MKLYPLTLTPLAQSKLHDVLTTAEEVALRTVKAREAEGSPGDDQKMLDHFKQFAGGVRKILDESRASPDRTQLSVPRECFDSLMEAFFVCGVVLEKSALPQAPKAKAKLDELAADVAMQLLPEILDSMVEIIELPLQSGQPN